MLRAASGLFLGRPPLLGPGRCSVLRITCLSQNTALVHAAGRCLGLPLLPTASFVQEFQYLKLDILQEFVNRAQLIGAACANVGCRDVCSSDMFS